MSFCEKNKNKIQIAILVAIGLIMFAVFLRMFYYQAVTVRSGFFPSDLDEHIDFARRGVGYSFLYSIMGLLLNTFDGVFPIAVLGSLMIVGTWLASAKIISMLMKNTGYFKSAIIALPILIVTGIYIPIIYPHFYSRQLISQPYHNITYYGMRLFVALAMIFFYKMFDNYLTKINVYHWIALAVLLALSTSVKPSLLYGFALSLLIFLIIDFFRCGFKAKPLSHIIILGLVVIPSLMIMLSQYIILFVKPPSSGGESSGIALIWGVNFVKHGFLQTALKLICSIGFPCLVAFVNRKELNRFEKFCYVMFFIELLIGIMFVETGKRAKHGNFFWGVYGGAYFMFIVAVPLFIKNVIQRKNEGRILTPYPIAGGILLTGHLVSSLVYFAIVMLGKSCLH